MSKNKIKKLKVVSTDLERILDGLDDFGWIEFIDHKEEIINATMDIAKQAGIIECLYELHLIGKGTYTKLCQDLDLALDELASQVRSFTNINDI